MFKNNALSPIFTSLLLFIHLTAAAAFFFPPEGSFFYFALGHYLWFGLASSLYYHRCLTHRAFELVTPLHIFFLLGGLLGLAGDPVNWAAMHRFHHQNPDRDQDIHSPLDGWMYAYFLWYMKVDPKKVEQLRPLARDLEDYWFVRWARGTVLGGVLHAGYAFVFYKAFGLPALLYGFYLPLCLSYQFPWMLIAFLCHTPGIGSRRVDTPDASRNIWWLGPATLGESFHNNHHEKPQRMPLGLQWHEIDLVKYSVFFLEKCKLARKVRWV